MILREKNGTSAATWSAVLLAAVLAFPVGAAAYYGGDTEGSNHSATSIGPRAAYYRLTDAGRSEWGPGVQLRLHGTAAYSLEVSGDRVSYSSQGANVRSTPIQATLLGYFSPDSAASPYLLLGGGWYPTHAAGPYRAPRLFGPHVGAGLEIIFGKSWSLDGSFRYLWTEVISTSKPNRIYGTDFGERGTMFTVGLNYRL